MIRGDQRARAGGFNLSPFASFETVSASFVTVKPILFIPFTGLDFQVPADVGQQGCFVIFDSNWTYIDSSNTFLVEVVLFATATEYYTYDSIILNTSAVVGASSAYVPMGAAGGATFVHGVSFSLRARFTPIGTPNPIKNVSVGILM